MFKLSPQRVKDDGYLERATHLVYLDILDWDELLSGRKRSLFVSCYGIVSVCSCIDIPKSREMPKISIVLISSFLPKSFLAFSNVYLPP